MPINEYGEEYSTDSSWASDPNYSGSANPVTGTDLSGITALITPFKGIFDRLKSGSTTANDVNAALGVLGLIMPSLNRPQTKGWKGTIDLNKQYTRTPIAQPEYKPYAQSASPVMGRQFFNTTYGAAPVAPPPTTPDPTIHLGFRPQIPTTKPRLVVVWPRVVLLQPRKRQN
jgi:hypothetical protein